MPDDQTRPPTNPRPLNEQKVAEYAARLSEGSWRAEEPTAPPWTLCVAFSRPGPRDALLKAIKHALDGTSQALVYETELSDGAPALVAEHPDKATLLPLLQSAAALPCRSVMLSVGV